MIESMQLAPSLLFGSMHLNPSVAVHLVEDRLVEDRLAEDRLAEDRLVEDHLVEDRLAEAHLEEAHPEEDYLVDHVVARVVDHVVNQTGENLMVA